MRGMYFLSALLLHMGEGARAVFRVLHLPRLTACAPALPAALCCAVQSSVRLSRLSRAATGQVMESLQPLHDELALAPVSGRLRGMF